MRILFKIFQQYLISFFNNLHKKRPTMSVLKEWAEVDSNHRSNLQQIYSLSPLATRESAHFRQNAKHSDNLKL